MYGQYSLLYLEASIQAYILERLKEFSTAISAQTLDLLIASSAAKREAASSASTLDLLTALSDAMRSASISAEILDLLRAASVSSLVAASSAANLERLKALSVATRSAATSASILDLLRAASVATSASILDLLSAASEAIRDAAISASTLDLLRELSASKAAKYLNRASDTSSRTCYILKMWEIKLFTPQQIQQKNQLLFIPILSLSYQNKLLAFFNQLFGIFENIARKLKDQLIFFGFLNNHKLLIKVHCIQSNLIFSYKHMSNNEQIDPSIYLYDEIYDDIKGKQKEQKERDRSRSRSREKKNKLQQQKPKQSKYIGKMKQIMDNRRKDHETAFEKKIVRENQKLGVNQEMVFVTESYLQKKLEEKQAAKKKKLEQEQAERQAPQRGDYVNFKKKMLDQSSKYKH